MRTWPRTGMRTRNPATCLQHDTWFDRCQHMCSGRLYDLDQGVQLTDSLKKKLFYA
jgi:hypothetical protein